MRKRKYLFLLITILLILCTSFTYGNDFFYAMKTFLYRNKASDINIVISKNDDIDNLNINFINEGSCDVFLRGFVFVYFINEDDSRSTVVSNDAIKINYNHDNISNEDSLWYMGEDSYLYYTKPLKVGDRTEIPLANDISLNFSDEEKDLLRDMEIKIDIVVEAVQVNNLAYKYEWEVKDDVLEKYFVDVSDDFLNEESSVYEKNDEVRLIIN